MRVGGREREKLKRKAKGKERRKREEKYLISTRDFDIQIGIGGSFHQPLETGRSVLHMCV